MDDSAPGGLFVIVYLGHPQEKYWGLLRRHGPAGIWLAGVPLRTVEEAVCNWGGGGDPPFLLTTTFFPMHRVEKISVDECLPGLPSLTETLAGRLAGGIPDLLPPQAFHLPTEAF